MEKVGVKHLSLQHVQAVIHGKLSGAKLHL